MKKVKKFALGGINKMANPGMQKAFMDSNMNMAKTINKQPMQKAFMDSNMNMAKTINKGSTVAQPQAILGNQQGQKQVGTLGKSVLGGAGTPTMGRPVSMANPNFNPATALKGLKSVAPTINKRITGTSMKKGGSVSSASKRADGCAVKGKTKGRIV